MDADVAREAVPGVENEPPVFPGEDPSRRRGVWILAVGVWIGTAAAVVLGISLGGGEPVGLGELALWLGILLGLNHLPVLRARTGKTFDIRFPFFLAIAFLFGPLVGAAVTGLADLKWCSNGREFRHMLVNSWVAAWSVAAAGAVFEVSAGAIGRRPIVLVFAAVAVVADMLVNYLLVAWVDCVWYGIPASEAFGHMRFGSTRETLLSHFVIGLMSLPIAALYLVIGPWALGMGLVLIAMARLELSRARDLELAKEQLSQRDAVIKGINALVAEERTDERRLIAASMHDDVLQSLHYLTLHAQVIREDLRHGKLLQLEEDIPLLLEISRRTAEQGRSLIGDLRVSPLGRRGLTEALGSVVDELADGMEHGRLIADIAEISGDAQRKTLIYQVAREALVNAATHSNAPLIRIRLSEELGEVLLVVEDNGLGFAMEGGTRERHFGLPFMRERVAAAGGAIQVASEIGVGTRVVATFPQMAQP